MKNYVRRMKGKGRGPKREPLKKVVWSWLGAFAGIYAIAAINEALRLSERDSVFLIGSFGASAVLVFGAPNAELGQPRNLVGGHVFSALVGVLVSATCGQFPVLACALAVSLSVVVMHLTRTLHPPGGATALIAVTGGAGVQTLGYGFAFFPVATASVVLLLIGLFVNNLSRNSKRHYPVFWF
ncbi:HPP family protein [Pelagicoccus sp. SDUM812005]|uniref:HPP family protein n=1 Tax=Pelagicoccus sp. SDUM812005 TaxID=3041257 RepID=UPI002810184E|nr:HPP family protein [Pelagicoccus sp. SDUM812005]MDQ8182226.1 HPP family protein [Pelagicoccus sp. SDUM812005]